MTWAAAFFVILLASLVLASKRSQQLPGSAPIDAVLPFVVPIVIATVYSIFYFLWSFVTHIMEPDVWRVSLVGAANSWFLVVCASAVIMGVLGLESLSDRVNRNGTPEATIVAGMVAAFASYALRDSLLGSSVRQIETTRLFTFTVGTGILLGIVAASGPKVNEIEKLLKLDPSVSAAAVSHALLGSVLGFLAGLILGAVTTLVAKIIPHFFDGFVLVYEFALVGVAALAGASVGLFVSVVCAFLGVKLGEEAN